MKSPINLLNNNCKGVLPYDFDQQFRLAYQWEKRTGKTLLRISDWNSNPKDVILPISIIHSAIEDSLLSLTQYAETAKLIETSIHIQQCLKLVYNVAFDSHVCTHLFGNTTQAIFGVMYALKKLIVKPKILFIHPSYYSATETAYFLDIPVVEMWRKRREQFDFDFEKIDFLRKKHLVNIIFLTDPVYSAGVRMNDAEWDILVNYCDREGIWIVIDMAFSGLSWNTRDVWIDRIQLLRANYKKCIILDSPAKRLFTNNIKIAIVFANAKIVKVLQELADSQLGNLTGIQLAFAKRLFNQQNKSELESICYSNAKKACTNFEYIQAIVSDSDHVFFEKPVAGFHALVFSKHITGESVDVMSTCYRWVTELETLAIPTNDFRFHVSDEFGIRLNLMRSIKEYKHIIEWIAKNGMLTK
jgi:aspartate/methionine/tyrosine aminotransferase